jgi:hypothetical protein
MKLSDAVCREGYEFTVRMSPWKVTGGLGSDQPGWARLYVNNEGTQYGIACVADEWDYAYSVTHEIAEHRHGFQHTAEMFAEQCNLMQRFLKIALAKGPTES